MRIRLRPRVGGFTLVELLVSMAILVLILAVVAAMVSQTSSVWQHTTGRVEQFREARDGFEAITRQLSQATLNTYWDYDNPSSPTKYIRQSELRFISGPQILGNAANASVLPARPTDAVFFQAPLGFVVPISGTDATYQYYRGMENLLNTWGYYIEYNNDAGFRPSALTTPLRTRFRLMEYMESSPVLSLYELEFHSGGNANYTAASLGTTGSTGAWAWFLNGVNCFANGNSNVTQTAPVHILAENVLALILLPKLTAAQEVSLTRQNSQSITDASLAPDYFYDSTGYDPLSSGTANQMPTVSGSVSYLDPINQLPPIVQVTMVAMDEISASRLSAAQNQAILTELGSLFVSSTNYSTDLAGGGNSQPAGGGLEPFLQSLRVNYREFTTDVSIKAAKWSTDQTH